MKITILGCGVMGSAFARKWVGAGHSLALCDHDIEKGKALAQEVRGNFFPEVEKAVQKGEIILLAIKPKDLKNISLEMGNLKDKIVISILAGTSLEKLKKHFPDATLIRCMPNLALSFGEALIAVVKEASLIE